MVGALDSDDLRSWSLSLMKNKRQDKEIWEKTRKRVWEKAQGHCERKCCRKKVVLDRRKPDGCEIHHVVPLCCGGTNNFRNLKCLCKKYHSLIDHSSHETNYKIKLRRGLIDRKDKRWNFKRAFT